MNFARNIYVTYGLWAPPNIILCIVFNGKISIYDEYVEFMLRYEKQSKLYFKSIKLELVMYSFILFNIKIKFIIGTYIIFIVYG